MKMPLIPVLTLILLFLLGACSVSHRPLALHDFGPTPVKASKPYTQPSIIVNAPTWLWDNRIRYRLLYLSPTHVGVYSLDLWVAPAPELFEQQLIASGKFQNYSLTIRLLDFEQQFSAPNKARVVMRWSVAAYSESPPKKLASHLFYLDQATPTPDAAGAVKGFAQLSLQAADTMAVWLAGLPDN
ncbi:MAG: hypothetical protein NTV43_15155 [Methylococcales bacterium]|nr:hypothetical protein [Methylococcales bacterium]